MSSSRLLEIEALMGIDTANSIRYDDQPKQIHKHFQIAKQENGHVLRAFALAGDIQATAYLRPMLESQTALLSSAELLRAKNPETSRQPSKIVCSCAHVSQAQIIKNAEEFYRRADDTMTGDNSKLAKQCLQGVQDQLGCGTHCGSCLPEVRRIISQLPVLA
ncbi:MAG: hypothetical protein E6Q34_06455 [Burkholderiaceae bacterium]|nr:MAG: hypothetical protein E6Q34_06455 [Burkholderiaceae bacterium]